MIRTTMKKTFFALAVLATTAPAALFAQTATPTIVGGDRDAHGCIPSAGYTWSSALQKCVRPWEQQNPINVTCVNGALDKRENALMTAHDVFNTSVKNALAARLAGLKDSYAALTKQDRKVKRDAVTKQFRASIQSAHNTLRDTRKATWGTFNTEMKACGVNHDERPNTVAIPATAL